MNPAEELNTPLPVKQPIPILRIVLTVFLSIIALGVLGVIGSIAVKAVNNHGLMPIPSPLARYECRGDKLQFVLFYLHGTERVKVQSDLGVLEGKVYQNWFDWGTSGNSSTLLGFVPPGEIVFEDAQTVRIAGRSFADLLCTNHVQTSSHRRSIVE
jgi:hypothetical protein